MPSAVAVAMLVDGAIVDVGLGDDIVDRGTDDNFANIEIAVAIADGGDGGTGGRGLVIADGDGTGEGDIASILNPITIVDGVTDRVSKLVGGCGLDQCKRGVLCGVDGDAIGIGGCAIRGGGGDVGDGAIVDVGLGDDIVDRGADDDFANIEIAVAIADGGDGGTGGRGLVIADGDGTGEGDIASILNPIAVVDGVTDRVSKVVGSRGLDQCKRGVLCGVDSDAVGIGGLCHPRWQVAMLVTEPLSMSAWVTT